MNECSFIREASMPGGATERTLSPREIKRRKILRAAIDVFAEKGYFAARMTDVAHRADVADGTLYLYFEGKEHLLVSIFDDMFSSFIQQLQAEIAELDDPLEKLRVMLRLHLQAMGRDRALAHVMQIETRHSRRFMSLFTRGRLDEYLGLLRGIIEEGQELGRFRRDIKPGLATMVVFGAVDELVTSWLLTERGTRLEAQLPNLMKLLSQGLVPCALHDVD